MNRDMRASRISILPISAFSFLSLTVLSTLILSSPLVSATDNTSIITTTTITINESCTMSGANDTEHTARLVNGTYSVTNYPSGIGLTTLKAFCNDSAGFAIYAIGYTNDEYGNTTLHWSKASSASDTTNAINTGIYTSGTTTDSTWSMKLTSVAGTYAATIDDGVSAHNNSTEDFTNWHAVPSEYKRVAYRLSGTDAEAEGAGIGSSITVTYDSYVSTTQPAGSYVGKVKYTLVHPASEVPIRPIITPSGKICYYANAATAEGTMGCQEVSFSTNVVRLFASNFSRTGYGFAGWSDAYDYETNPNAHFYGPNETINFTAGDYTDPNPGLSLYAIWIPSAGNFQDSSKTATICSGLTQASVNGTRTLASVSALTDTRDNQTYAIAKLADGNCWMIENLRLDNTAELTTLNTNNPLNDGTNVTLKHNYTDSQIYNTLSATSSVAYNADTAPDGWCTSNSAACDDQSRLRTDNTTNRATYTSRQTMSSAEVNLYSYGNYYNWYSATAGRGTYSFGTNNDSTAGDLCPANWRLPKGGDKTRIESNDDNDFWNLIVDALNGGTKPNNYASETRPYYTGSAETGPVDVLMRTWPNNFVRSGYVNGASLSSRYSYGLYWSSTVYSSSGAYNLTFSDGGISPGAGYANKYYGRSIRCLVSPSA